MKTPLVYIVVYPEQGIASATMDLTFAKRHAKAVDGVVIAVPIMYDYRMSDQKDEPNNASTD